MLTFFCPWRTGIDLKLASDSWEDAFNKYIFMDCQRELMDNFNLKFKCYNAKDNFAAKRAAGGGKVGHSEIPIDVTDLDHVNGEDWVSAEGGAIHDGHESEGVVVDGLIMENMRLAQKDTLKVLKAAGWSEAVDNTTVSQDIPMLPSQHRDSRAWEAYIKKESARLWKAKFATLDVLPNAGSTRTKKLFKPVRNNAWIMRPSYLSTTYTPVDGHWGEVMDEVVSKFTLNDEQTCAFKIITNHASSISADQLLMHLGGMGGTGKSCVIHALVNYFNRCDEPYRFVLLGPTGTSAALIGGSTYHSFLGLGRNTRNKSGQDPSLEDLPLISSCLAAATQKPEPFGGLHVILMGDFAQLPPIHGKALYSRNISMLKSARTQLLQETAALGKHYWLQFTCVVILKQNMCQLGDSPCEVAFRRALENLRYKACTKEDIALLESRVAEINPGL
ncbi:hypothetical protein BJ165DRAFT_1534978 [Panaeolus papilionaceus]|nr:hypothetical protein BJ165DRAFT_1534978 [Panaeolus papilionaceus]